ncbi:hypothetical protein GOP47_0001845 [Adiantum capillus-veneris]|uniref:TIR domain-containing protein n=1 Tax=Adiantum capillus-veneris TaxID=13818 RepID=A0A9D4ZQI5_ADICA|nr:hypothetical protein GOP47_0001845 [Adiantum capillus-veneris]
MSFSITGPDVKKSFVDHLSASFEAAGIHCFVDYKSIHSGEPNWVAIEHAIQHCNVHIAIFSPDYAASSWCLKELVNILECPSSQLFLPVFFNVRPCDLRYIDSASSKSCYSSAFRKLARRHGSQEIQNWINALEKASEVHGLTLQDTAQGFEARLVKLIFLRMVSQIVITTRDKQIVIWANAHQYFMEGLDKSDSHLLFNRHAFPPQEEPSGDLKALAGKVVHACDGLPLALETLGAHLYRKEKVIWEKTVKVLEGHQHTLTPAQKKVTEILKISFDGLGSEERLMFLDIACFMLGEHEDRAKRLWCESDAAVLYLDTLILKFLVKIDEERNLTMHDLLRDMGREIVEHSHKNIWKRSHLWNEDDVRLVLQHEKGTSLVRGVKLLTLEEGEEWGVKSFAGMDFLRFLVLSGNGHITGNFCLFPKELRWFQWHWCPLEFLPSKLTLSKVVVLDLSKSQISSLCQGGHRFEATDGSQRGTRRNRSFLSGKAGERTVVSLWRYSSYGWHEREDDGHDGDSEPARQMAHTAERRQGVVMMDYAKGVQRMVQCSNHACEDGRRSW